MVGRGRPRTGERVDVRYPADLLARIDARAEREGVSRAELLRRIADEAVATGERVVRNAIAHDVIAMTREEIERPDDWTGMRVFDPGPVTLWVDGRPVGYLSPEQQATVSDVLRGGTVPPDLTAWVRGLGFPDWSPS